jgi:hypothetical protein
VLGYADFGELAEHGCGVLRKPFVERDLANKLRALSQGG